MKVFPNEVVLEQTQLSREPAKNWYRVYMKVFPNELVLEQNKLSREPAKGQQKTKEK